MGKRGRKGGGKNKRKRDDGGGRVMMEGVRRFEPIQTIIANLGTAEPTIIWEEGVGGGIPKMPNCTPHHSHDAIYASSSSSCSPFALNPRPYRPPSMLTHTWLFWQVKGMSPPPLSPQPPPLPFSSFLLYIYTLHCFHFVPLPSSPLSPLSLSLSINLYIQLHSFLFLPLLLPTTSTAASCQSIPRPQSALSSSYITNF